MGTFRRKLRTPRVTPFRRSAAGGRPKSRRSVRLAFEPLEPRVVLDGGPLITEFLAINDDVLADEDGDYPDWIEIYNPTGDPVELGGWHLTDDATDLTRWEFPAYSLAADEYLVVFASAKDRTGGELHANFELDADGEYLALVEPDGSTVAHQYSPTFPPQFTDISFGVAQEVVALVPEGAGLTYLVPTSAEGPLGTTWTLPSFNDSTWTGSVREPLVMITEAGTDSPDFVEIQNVTDHTVDTSGWVVAVNDASGEVPDINNVEEVLWQLPGAMSADELLYRHDDPDDPDHYWEDDIFWRAKGPGWVMIVDDQGKVADFVVWGYSDSEIASLGVNINGFDVTGGAGWAGDAVELNTDSTFTLQRTGDSDHDNATDWAFAPSPSPSARNPGLTTPFLTGGGSRMTGIGFDVGSSGLGDAIQSDVEDEMYGQNASLWTRIAFFVEDVSALSTLKLRMKYNDGFVAYLNGQIIADGNAPDSPTWNSHADAWRSAEDSLLPEEINVSDYLGALVTGMNVLAIHGLNFDKDDPNFLILPEMVATKATGEQNYFVSPTPGEPNGVGAIGFVEDTRFSVDRGFYDTEFDVQITTATPGATIVYTTDGSEPTASNGTQVPPPDPGSPPVASVPIAATTTLRAAAFEPDYVPTNVDTQTYVFLADVIGQSPTGQAPPGWPSGSVGGQVLDYGIDPDILDNWDVAAGLAAIPSISLVTDLDNLFDPTTGIYVNAEQDGRDWERPASVELIYPDGTEGFQVEAGLRIRGGYSREGSNPKHALRLFFREEYGDAKLEYPLFGNEGVDTFDKLDLRTSQNYSWSFDGDGRNAMVRDVSCRDTQAAMDQPYTRSRYYHLYINGQYWGLYQSQERPEAAYGESYFGGDREDYDTIKVDRDAGYTIHATDGNLDAWQDLFDQTVAGFASDEAYYRVQGLNPDGTRNPDYPVLVDVDNLIDYMLTIFYTGDRDAPISSFMGNQKPQNWYGVRSRNGEEGFRFFIHDAEHTLSLGAEDRTGPFPIADPPGEVPYQFQYSNPQWIHQELMAHPEYRLRFADHAHKHLMNDGVLTPGVAADRFMTRADQIDTAIIAESARWGDAKVPAPYDKNDWLAVINDELDTFFYGEPDRAQTVLGQLKTTTLPTWRGGGPARLYPDVGAAVFYIDDLPQHGGQVEEDAQLTMSAASGKIYYMLDGSDPRLPGGDVLPTAKEFTGTPIALGESTLVKARVHDGGEWSAVSEAQFYVGAPADAGNLIVTEIMYNPAGDGEAEFVELQNIGDVTVDLTGVEFTGGIRFGFSGSNVTRLDPGEFAVAVRDLAVFQARYGTEVVVAGQYDDALENAGERITLMDRFGQPIFRFAYDDEGDWPGRADGAGSSLELIDPMAVPATDPQRTDYLENGDNWRSSSEYGGTPGGAGTGPVPDVVVNEVLSNPVSPDVDAIELYNVSDHEVDVSGWFLSDKRGEYEKFQIPGDARISGGGYEVFYYGIDFDFGLGAGGDDVWLLEADAEGNLTRFADHVEFDEALPGVSFGRWPNGTGELVLMSEVTLGEENAEPLVGRVIINELHIRPDVKTELVEFVELYNRSQAAVDLSGWYFSNGISYTFPDDTILPVGGYVVIAQDEAAVDAKFGIDCLGSYADKLDNDGERLVLRDAHGIIQDEVDYKLGFPWPTVGDSPGYSMELINPELDNDLGGSWRASTSDASPDSEVLIDESQDWFYRKGNSEASNPVSAWRQLDFQYDATWAEGQAAIGYPTPGEALEEGKVKTVLGDMRGNYTSFFLRKTFEVADASQVTNLMLEAWYDDAFVAWINGKYVKHAYMASTEPDYNDTATRALDKEEFEEFPLPSPSGYLGDGTNVLAVQVFNSSLSSSSDAFFDARLVATSGPGGTGPTPGAVNAVFAANGAPQMRQVGHSPKQPASGENVTVTAKVTDPDGVESVTLGYQLVNPGEYINREDSRYNDPGFWSTVTMYDDGTHGDECADDDVYTAVLPGTLQTNRRLVRYRITSIDTLGASVTAPYDDDPQPNFAYYVYDGVPSWTGSARPGVEPYVEYSSELVTSLPVYTLITDRQDHLNAMHVPYRWGAPDQQLPTSGEYWGSSYKWYGTLVYDGEVYDHVTYRARGGCWRYSMGKNMWKFDFKRGHYFQAHDDYGNPYDFKWDKINFSAVIQQGNYWHRGEQGLFEAVGFKLFNLAGVEASNMNSLHFRIVEDADEGGPDQFSTDFRGLYMTIEQPDGRLLDEHGLPDGNFYKMEGGGGDLNNQGPTQPTDKSDLNQFINTYGGTPSEQWWRDNFELEKYYSYRSIVEAIHQYDIAYGKNYFYYHNPENDKWSIHPWDLDLTWANNMYGSGNHVFKSKVADRAEFRAEYRSRMREIRDLLYNPEQTGMLIDEIASFIDTQAEEVNSFVGADRAMWDYNPILVSSYVKSSKAGHGRFYAGYPPGIVIPAPGGFRGMVQKMKNYVVSRGAWIDSTILDDDHLVPNRPTVTYTGPAGHPVDELVFRSSAFGSSYASFAAMKWRIAEVTDPASPTFDPTQPRKYEITATWQSNDITTFDESMTIPGYDLEVGKTYRVRVRMKDTAGRWSHWSTPVQFEAGMPIGPVAEGLLITELNYDPYGPTPDELEIDDSFRKQDFQFVELQNVSEQTIDLNGVVFTDGIDFDFTGGSVTQLGPQEFVVVVKNTEAFEARYSPQINVAGQFTKQLNEDGERIVVCDWLERAILDFEYKYEDTGPWPGRSDGKGASLELVNPAAVPQHTAQRTDYLQDANHWRSSGEYGGSPGREGEGPRGDVLVNEVLSNPPGLLADAIELHNTTDEEITVGGWYLSDSWGWESNPDNGNYKKYRIPPGTKISAHGYVAFDEDDFNPSGGTDPNDFSLDGARGGDVWLMEADAGGKLSRFVDHVDFMAARGGESLGRWPNGQGELYPMAEITLGSANTGPRVGPVVVSELQYNPGQMEGADDLEYVEIYNATDETVDLTSWVIREGVEFDFPTGTLLAPYSPLVVLPFDPKDDLNQAEWLAFCDEYGLDGDDKDRFVGGYAKQLDNGGERVQLLHPDDPVQGFIPHFLEDEVIYDDENGWPPDADGEGESLHRLEPDAWGNHGANWFSADPTPGSVLFLPSTRVVSRYVFYNNSVFDGNDPAANEEDNDAIAHDKVALRRRSAVPGRQGATSAEGSMSAGTADLQSRSVVPGRQGRVSAETADLQTAGFDNYTSYSRGINGIIVDIANPLVMPTGDDFLFHVGNGDDPGSWLPGPNPFDVTVTPGAGDDDPYRVTIIWPDYAICNTWLQVTVQAVNLGLVGDDVFYFGNAVGESGNSVSDAIVDETDVVLARNNPRNFFYTAPITFPYDYNRDARVDASDMLIARSNPTDEDTALKLIDPAGPEGAGDGQRTLVATALGEEVVCLTAADEWGKAEGAWGIAEHCPSPSHPGASLYSAPAAPTTTSARDAALEEAAASASAGQAISSARLAWLCDFEPTRTPSRPTQKANSPAVLVDKLLAGGWL